MLYNLLNVWEIPIYQYKEADGKKLLMKVEIRWNSVYDRLESYIQNWPFLVSIHLDELIYFKTKGMNIKNNAKYLINRLKPVYIALSSLQSDKCKTSNEVKTWK